MSKQQPTTQKPTFGDIYERFHGSKVMQENSFEMIYKEATALYAENQQLKSQLSQLIQEKRAMEQVKPKPEEKGKSKLVQKAKN